jgi:hypothetical protein
MAPSACCDAEVEMTQRTSEFKPLPIAPQSVLKRPLASLLEWNGRR